ncbi:MlaC/ttg2D family ABC transporter substrate-binding protein [Pararobbsia silviterrae]|uniref:ABC transporter substrate-binding protein n=1 Tax=Pararobbsia silviterrae TaxID=1792498 RepID=A0A494XA93_9BURK|nr:ABC transporter substrate-binding protein [Pararobbsia silviterrae]RKP46561.1 ABC transporter substrate-binding protein [Pararobbsia silviterrae]
MKKLLVAVLALCVMTVAYGQSAKSGPNDVVKDAVEATVKAAKADPAARDGDLKATIKVVETNFLPYTDFRRTTRIAVGQAWNTATPDQQKQLFEQFQQLLVNTYALQLTQVRGQAVKFKIDPAQLGANGKDAVVQSDVSGINDDLQVGYRLGLTDDGWKIYDIDMGGAWLIRVYQQQFAGQLAQGGVDALIKFLVDHNARVAQ